MTSTESQNATDSCDVTHGVLEEDEVVETGLPCFGCSSIGRICGRALAFRESAFERNTQCSTIFDGRVLALAREICVSVAVYDVRDK